MGVLLVVIGGIARPEVAGDGVEGLARGRPFEVIARLYHTRQVIPGVCSGVPGDHAIAGREVDVASCEHPPAVVNTGGGRRAARRQIGNCCPGVGAWIVAPSVGRRGIATARVNIAAKGSRHQVMVGKWVVRSHGPAICGNIVNLDMIICADSRTCDAVDFAVEVGRAVEVGGNAIRGQACVICIADRVVAPKRGRRREVLVHAAKQVDIGAVACGAEPATRCRKGGDGRPGIGRGGVLISVCDSGVVSDAAETIDVATL